LQEVSFRKSSFSNPSGNCVEVALSSELIVVRDSKDPNAGALRFDHGEWDAFIMGVKAGEFDAPS
jgi:hypothetical protein